MRKSVNRVLLVSLVQVSLVAGPLVSSCSRPVLGAVLPDATKRDRDWLGGGADSIGLAESSGEMTIDGRPWQVLVGEGHSPEHACLWDAERRLLVAGDQLMPRNSSNLMVSSTEPEADPLQRWFVSLDRLDTLPEDTLVLPSHDEVFRGVHRRTRMLRWHHQRTLDRLAERLVQGRAEGGCTAVQAMAALYPRLRGPMDEVLALGETLAHLNWFIAQGRVTRTLDDQGVHRYA